MNAQLIRTFYRTPIGASMFPARPLTATVYREGDRMIRQPDGSAKPEPTYTTMTGDKEVVAGVMLRTAEFVARCECGILDKDF